MPKPPDGPDEEAGKSDDRPEDFTVPPQWQEYLDRLAEQGRSNQEAWEHPEDFTVSPEWQALQDRIAEQERSNQETPADEEPDRSPRADEPASNVIPLRRPPAGRRPQRGRRF